MHESHGDQGSERATEDFLLERSRSLRQVSDGSRRNHFCNPYCVVHEI